ncbi:PAS domain S-box protein [Sphingomonas sp. PAMC 26617]|uniref:PAS domain S-box protein n=1 Tax=Sphingomonas sp. PAMC 26617 TaxID=1112216 RepID=UPI000288A821|nr:PAS domain S-box protein [Sphingomonas sp. PAMC 26617]
MIAKHLARQAPVAVLLAAAIFGAMAYASITLTQDVSRVAAVWFPNAILVAILLRKEERLAGAYVPAAFLANVVANMLAGDAIGRAVGLSGINALEISAIVWGMRRAGVACPNMSNLRDLIAFGAIGGVAMPLLAGALAPLVLGASSVHQGLTIWIAWSMTDGLGMLIVAPSIMIIAGAVRVPRWPPRSQAIEIATIALIATAFTTYIFWQSRYPFLFLDAPLVLLCAFRLGSIGTACALLDIAVIATIATASGHGPIHLVRGGPTDQIMVLQIFLASCFVMGLPVAASLHGKRRLQNQLQQSEERFRHMTDSAPIGVFRADEHGQLTYVNRVWSEKVGLTIEEMLGDGWRRALNTDVPFEEDPTWRGFNKPGDVRRRVTCFHGADGADLWIETVNAAEFDQDGKLSGFIGAAHDVTEQRRVNERLSASERRFQALANLAPAGIFRTDASGGCSYVNDSWLQTTGLKNGEWENSGWVRALHPDDQDRVFEGWAQAVAEQRDYRADFRWIKPDGSCSWVDVIGRPEHDVDGAVTGFIGVSLDITERRHAEQILAEREQQLRILASNATDAVLRISLTGQCLYASPSATRLLGVPAEHLVGTQILARFHPEDDATVRDAFAELAAGAINHRTIAYRAQSADDPTGYRWFEAHCGLVRDEDHAPREIIASIRDVSDNKALEEDLKTARQRAESAASAKAAFLANMSHEIRTPMNGVLGFTELLGMTELSAEQRRHVDLIADSGRSMMRLLNDILDISKIDSGQMEIAHERVDLRHSLKSAARLMEPIAQSKGVAILIDVSDSIPQAMMGDRLRIRQIMLNLIGNAVKFTEHGKIAIRARSEGAGAHASLVMDVEDSGIGIAADRLTMIFEQFAQADSSTARKYGGTGLGLAISSNLARLMGGTITVRSVEGRGTTFTVTLPLVAGDPAAVAATIATSEAAAPTVVGQARVLIAEDHDINQMLILALAEAADLDATLATNGAEAIAKVEEAAHSGKPFDLVLMDVQMPVIDGLEATRRLRAGGFSAEMLPIVALTANAYVEDVQACHTAGMQAHLAKPVRLRDIQAIVTRFCRADGVSDAATAAPDPIEPMPAMKSAAERYAVRRLQTLEAIAEAARRKALDGVLVTDLASMLHKLAGSAGFFGEAELGQIAAEAERSLVTAAPDDWTRVVAEVSSTLQRAA